MMTVNEVLSARARRQRQWRWPLLHGRCLARPQGRRPGRHAGDDPRSESHGPGNLRHLWPAAKRPGRKLKDAGLDYYNHNLDTAPDKYADIISTRDYQDRLDTWARCAPPG